jgi:hypothetical protein
MDARSSGLYPLCMHDLWVSLFIPESRDRVMATREPCAITRIPVTSLLNVARADAHPHERTFGMSRCRKTIDVARAQVERTGDFAGFMRTASAERSEVAIQTRGGWKIEVFSPVAVGAGSSNVRPVGALVSRLSSAPSGVPHCCELSSSDEAVEIGKGSRLEQARPEHGLRRVGASSGEPATPSCR